MNFTERSEAGMKPHLHMDKYPHLSFPKSWEVKIIPGYPYADIRFVVRKKGSTSFGVSVYLDCQEALGCVGQPYWEIYPYCDGETRRFLLGEEMEMLKAIRYALASSRSVERKYSYDSLL